MWATVAEVLGTLLGVLYLYWEYRADAKVWVAGMLMPAVSLVVYWQSGLYADFGINVYYLLAAVYGLWAWRSHRDGHGGEPQAKPITRVPLRSLPQLALAFVVLQGGIGLLLLHTDSTVPWADAFTTAMSVVGMWMLARKWVEQWWAWILVDAVSTVLYVCKGIYFYAVLYALYTVVAFFGYRAWRRMMRGQQ